MSKIIPFKSRAQKRQDLADLISEKQGVLDGARNVLKEEYDLEMEQLAEKLEKEIPELEQQLLTMNEDLK